MSEVVLTSLWQNYDADQHGGQGGSYIFLLKAFSNAPYYVGETENFAQRFCKNGRSHKQLFAGGHRTFMRRPFIDECIDRSHTGFAARWYYYKQQSALEQQRLVWVATNYYNEALGREGTIFWESQIELLVSLGRRDRHSIEKRVQTDVMNYYDSLLKQAIDWRIPSTKSRLVGRGPKVATGPKLTYRRDGQQPVSAEKFFATLGM